MYQEQFLWKGRWIVSILFIIILIIVNKSQNSNKKIKWIVFFVFISLCLLYNLYVINQQPNIPNLKKNEILSPSSGYIGSIKQLEDKTIIMFNLSFWSNHVQYIPYNGRVISDEYYQSKYLLPRRMFVIHPTIFPNFEESIRDNEKYHTILETELGTMEVTRIAGLVAPRVWSFIKKNQMVKQGEVMGLIVFSSMVLLTLPSDVTLNIKEGDNVVAGETIIAYK